MENIPSYRVERYDDNYYAYTYRFKTSRQDIAYLKKNVPECRTASTAQVVWALGVLGNARSQKEHIFTREELALANAIILFFRRNPFARLDFYQLSHLKPLLKEALPYIERMIKRMNPSFHERATRKKWEFVQELRNISPNKQMPDRGFYVTFQYWLLFYHMPKGDLEVLDHLGSYYPGWFHKPEKNATNPALERVFTPMPEVLFATFPYSATYEKMLRLILLKSYEK